MSSMETSSEWKAVDEYFESKLITSDTDLNSIKRSSANGGLPPHEVSPCQAKFLYLLAKAIGARYILEFGTLAGYSTAWFAKAVGPQGMVVTLEKDDRYALLARENFLRLGLDSQVTLIQGDAALTAQQLLKTNLRHFDMVFIDADKANNPNYLKLAIELVRDGGLIIGDNVVRNGQVVDSASQDRSVQGVRGYMDMLFENTHLESTAIQTVGIKGWDGFAMTLVHHGSGS